MPMGSLIWLPSFDKAMMEGEMTKMNQRPSASYPPLHLGVRAHDFGVLPLEELLARVKHYGFTHVQLAVRKSFPDSVPNMTGLSPGTAHYLGNAFRQAGIHITVLGCYVNIIAPDPVQRAEALDSFAAHLRLARDFGASLVGTETGSVGAGYTKDNFTVEAYQAVVRAVRIMVAEAERFGATVGIEAGQNHPLHSAPLARKLLEAIPSNNLQIILDCANLMSPDNSTRQAEVVAEALNLLGNRIAVVHLKDYKLDNGKIVIVPPGQGELDFKPILRYMKYERPHIHGILESTPESHMADSIAYLKQLYEEV
ncbi:sugar phosphate isomerase/epimerase family protein [Paenibacillus antibioticophila]|nr:sugar phosphate isomerase/epimerase [Paenibacillus antibioticophila]